MARQSNKDFSFKERVSYRKTVQFIFLFITVFLGVKFYGFVSQLEAGGTVTITRPPGVEAFLPISALVSLKYFLFTGIFNLVHPSALVIFLIICMTALIFKKGFCSWICPIGVLSDMLSRLHKLLFKSKISIPPWVDKGLRTIKYLIAGFFIWSIFVKMPVNALEHFIYSPYNRFADVKMLEFFTHISDTALVVIVSLSLLSVVIPYFWCRYLCPYGAVLSFLGRLSLGRIKRNLEKCTNCKQCESVCPGKIQITEKPIVNSVECTSCLTCVDACPHTEAIGFSLGGWKIMKQKGIALTLIALFFIGIMTARLTGYWQNDTSINAYRSYLIKKQSPRAVFKDMDPEKMKRMIEMMKKMQQQSRS
jgi:polyferredoxin